MYDSDSNERTYSRLTEIAGDVLHAGYSVIIDATFLKQTDRERFHDLAQRNGVPLAILDCHSDPQTLRQRIADRREKDNDASDADLDVLDHQIAHHEPLSGVERSLVVDVPDVVQIADRL
jgi:predicted kinase